MDVQVQKVSTNWEVMPKGLTYYFIGQPKTWKTSAASKWSDKGHEGVLLIDTDLGGDFVDGANVVTVTELRTPTRYAMKDGNPVMKDGEQVVEEVPNDERGYMYRSGPKIGQPMPVYSFTEVYQWLRKSWKDLPYDTIAIDTIDRVNGWIEEIVVKELGISVMGEGEWGTDWGRARKRSLDVVRKLQRFLKSKAADLILISHSKTSAVTDGKVQLAPELPRGLGYALTAQADVIGYSTIPKGSTEAHLSFVSYDERTIGSRLRPLFQKDLKFDYETIKNEMITYQEEEEVS